MSQFITMLTLLSFPLVLATCNTMEGMGQDIQKGGEKLENAADRSKDRR